MSQIPLSIAADYADALLTARRAKSLVTALLLSILLIQLALFFFLRYDAPLPAADTALHRHTRDVVQYFTGLCGIAGLFLPVLLAITLYLILKVQLVGRLLGTARLTSAFLWSILLLLLLFPWQAVLNNPAINSDPIANSMGMKIPGVLYTWAEISHPVIGARFGFPDQINPRPQSDPTVLALHWVRFVAFPVLSVLLLAMIHFKSQHGLRQSLGEAKTRSANPPGAPHAI